MGQHIGAHLRDHVVVEQHGVVLEVYAYAGLPRHAVVTVLHTPHLRVYGCFQGSSERVLHAQSPRGKEQWEKVGNWTTQGEKSGAWVSGVLCAPLPWHGTGGPALRWGVVCTLAVAWQQEGP
eukprot:1185790-Prorocentrum_minimum.AAC.2